MGGRTLEMNTTVNIFVVQIINMDSNWPYKLVGVYSSKELADAAGIRACEMWEEDGRMTHTVTILALDDLINGVDRYEL